MESLMRLAARRRLDAVVVFGEANIRSLTGVVCDNGCLLVDVAGGRRVVFCTDFRYVPMVHRVAPWLCVRELRRGKKFGDFLRQELSVGGIDHRAHHSPAHIVKEAVGADGDRDEIPLPLCAAPVHRADGGLRLGADAAHSPEIVRALKGRGRARHPFEIEMLRIKAGAPVEEGIADRAVE
jgi:hypothetical protein